MGYIDQLDFQEVWNMDDADSRKFVQRWIDKEWTYIQQKEATILPRLQEGPEIASLEPEWIQQRGYPRHITAQATGGTTITFSGHFNGRTMTPELMQQVIGTGTILQKRVAGVTHQVKISDTDFTDLAVSAAAYGNTSWANDTSPVEYRILDAPGKDKDPFKHPTSLPREILQTYTRIFKREVESHFQRRQLAMHGIQDEFLHQVELHMRALKDMIQTAILYDRPYYANGEYKSAMAVEDATLGGIIWWVERMQELEPNREIYVNAGGEPLNQTMLDNLGRSLVKKEQANLGEGGYEIWMHGDQFGNVQDFEKDFRRTTADRKKVGFSGDEITLKEGQTMKLLGDDIIDPDICLMLPTKTIEHGYFKNDGVRRDKTNTDPRHEEWLIHCGKWGVKPANPRWIGLIYNLGS